MKSFIVFVLLVVFFVSGCTKEEVTTRPYPRVVSKEVTNITADGAILHGELIYITPNTTDYGFVWTDAGFPTLDNNRVSLNAPTTAMEFEAVLKTKIVKNQTYTMRTYAVGDGYTVYGESIDFMLN